MNNMLKRNRFELEAGEIERQAMANCLMLLSQIGRDQSNSTPSIGERTFTCKTCNRQFPSFQALGGHRASHKKAKPAPSSSSGENSTGGADSTVTSVSTKPKNHTCLICGLEFPIGQALGGHMRRHRAAAISHDLGGDVSTNTSTVVSSAAIKKDDVKEEVLEDEKRMVPPTLLKKAASGKRVCLGLDVDFDFDLNSPPVWDDANTNDSLKLRLGFGPATTTAPPMVGFI